MGCCLVAVDKRNGCKPWEGILIPRVGELAGATNFLQQPLRLPLTTPHT
jgi:hypothetical protein